MRNVEGEDCVAFKDVRKFEYNVDNANLTRKVATNTNSNERRKKIKARIKKMEGLTENVLKNKHNLQFFMNFYCSA